MNMKYSCLVYSLAIILCLAAAGCLKPPTDGTETPVVTTPRTPIPLDATCSIYTKTGAYAYNGTAFTFNQKNPPMFINYTVIPKNVTKTQVSTEAFGTYMKTPAHAAGDYVPTKGKGSARTEIRSVYSTSSWFEVTVRDGKTNEIILQDGFGEAKGYPTYLSRTLKVLKSGDLLVEFKGNDITASVTVWVKPHGNFDESRLSEITDCMYWEGNRDTLATAAPTTIKGVIYTWTPENKVTSHVQTMVTQGLQVPRNESNY